MGQNNEQVAAEVASHTHSVSMATVTNPMVNSTAPFKLVSKPSDESASINMPAIACTVTIGKRLNAHSDKLGVLRLQCQNAHSAIDCLLYNHPYCKHSHPLKSAHLVPLTRIKIGTLNSCCTIPICSRTLSQPSILHSPPAAPAVCTFAALSSNEHEPPSKNITTLSV